MKEPGSGKNAAARLLCLPGESGWELWSISAASREKLPDAPKEAQAAPAGASIGLPVRHATIVSLWLQSADPGLFRELIAAQLERLDLLRNASTPWTHLPSARDGERTLVTAYILDPDLPPALLCPGARTYDVSARCRPLPKEGWAVWREEGGIVAACSRGGCLVAAHFFPGTSVFGEIAPDLASLVRSLVWEKIALPDAPCVLWGAFPEADSAQASAVFRSPASAVPVPPPILPEPPLGLLPSPIRAQQQARSQGKRRQTLYLYAAVAYLLAAGAALAGLGWLKWRERQMEGRAAANAPTVGKLSATAARWHALEPAIDPRRYPIEALLACVQNLPQELRLTQFDHAPGKILIMGEGKDAASIFNFFKAVEADPLLRQWKWTMPQPQILPNNRAQFQMEGSRGAATTH